MEEEEEEEEEEEGGVECLPSNAMVTRRMWIAC
jgi:hypothetical protein